jgi:proteasome lid subunit RPN8/RPN11
MDVTCEHARSAAPHECMGLLASRRGDRSGVVTDALRLRAKVSLARAVADPLGIARVVARLRRQGMIPRGYWHSHVHSAAYHSSVDDATMMRLLPGMAEENFLRPLLRPTVPMVTGSDEAWLPLPDGRALAFTLAGPLISGLDARETARWSSVSTRFRERAASPRAVQRDGYLYLSGGSVVLILGLPGDATLSSRLVDPAPLRVATMFSLVVNVRGEAFATALTVHDLDGRTFTEMGPCTIEIVEQRNTGGQPIGNGHVATIEPAGGR